MRSPANIIRPQAGDDEARVGISAQPLCEGLLQPRGVPDHVHPHQLGIRLIEQMIHVPMEFFRLRGMKGHGAQAIFLKCFA